MRTWIFPLLIFWLGIGVHASSPLDPPLKKGEKVFLFVDLNAGEAEVKTARELARARGERFVLIPREAPQGHALLRNLSQLEGDQLRVLGVAQKKYEALSEAERQRLQTEFDDRRRVLLKKLREAKPEERARLEDELAAFDQGHYRGVPDLQLKEVWERIVKVQTSYRSFKNQLDVQQELDAFFQSASQQKAVLKHVSISGHDGGSRYSGKFGYLKLQEWKSQVTDRYPGILDQVNSVGLLGCYTVTPSERALLHTAFPGRPLFDGYNASGPSNVRKEGWDKYKAVVLNAERLLRARDEKELKAEVSRIASTLQKVNAGIMVPLRSTGGGPARDLHVSCQANGKISIVDLDHLPCAEAVQLSQNFRGRLIDFFTGYEAILDTPEFRQSGKIREVYTFFRQYGKACLEEKGSNLPENAILLLNFYPLVRKNFQAVHADEIEKCGAELQTLDLGKRAATVGAILGPSNTVTSEVATGPRSKGRFEKAANDLRAELQRVESNLAFQAADPEIQRAILESLRERVSTLEAILEAYSRGVKDGSWELESLQIKLMNIYRASTTWGEGGVTEVRSRYQAFLGLASVQGTPGLKGIHEMSRKELSSFLHEFERDFLPEEVPLILRGTQAFGCLKDLRQAVVEQLWEMSCAPYEWHEFDASEKPTRPLCGAGSDRKDLRLPVTELERRPSLDPMDRRASRGVMSGMDTSQRLPEASAPTPAANGPAPAGVIR